MKTRLEHAPLTYLALEKLLRPCDTSSSNWFASEFGATKGLSAPHEAGEFWNRWFPTREHYTSDGTLSTSDQNEIRHAAANIERLRRAPFVNKNVKHSVRIAALLGVFPNALFVNVRRNPTMTAQSIFLVRLRRRNPGKWWSVKPKQFDRLKQLSPLEQAASQVFWVTRNIDAARTNVGNDRFCDVSYEEFCACPAAVVQSIADFMARHGAPTERAGSLPESFDCSADRRLPEAEFAELSQHIDYLFSVHASDEKIRE